MIVSLHKIYDKKLKSFCVEDKDIIGAMASQITSLTIVCSTVLFRRRSKKISKLLVTGLCVGNSPATGEFPAQMASNAENVSIWWRHHVYPKKSLCHCCWWFEKLKINSWHQQPCYWLGSPGGSKPLHQEYVWKCTLGDPSFSRKRGHYLK